MSFEELHIPHWSEGLASIANPTPFVAQDQQITPPGKSRLQRETELWMSAYKAFQVSWNARSTDFISDDHPQQDWVTRQRKLYRSKKLMPWKRTLLDAIGFPYISCKEAQTLTDEAYAIQLFAFYQEHGHYAPTITVGGAGLTTWTRKMKESCGLSGHASGSPESARAALTYLKKNIPAFDFEKISKSKINVSKGLSFNGFQKGCKNGNGYCVDDSHTSVQRAWFALRYPLTEATKIAGLSPQVRDICERARFFEQAVRVVLETPQATETWWLVGGDEKQLSVSRTSRGLSSLEIQSKLVSFREADWGEFNVQEGLYEVILLGDDDLRITLDYDVCLADWTHRYCHPLTFEDFEASNAFKRGLAADWESWLDGSMKPKRFVGSKSTANATFEKNLVHLQESIARHKETFGFIHIPNIAWSTWRVDYKFIEHEVLRARQGDIPPSHVERLVALDVTWGSQNKGLAQLLCQPEACTDPIVRSRYD